MNACVANLWFFFFAHIGPPEFDLFHHTGKGKECNILLGPSNTYPQRAHYYTYMTYIETQINKRTMILEDVSAALAYVEDQLNALRSMAEEEAEGGFDE